MTVQRTIHFRMRCERSTSSELRLRSLRSPSNMASYGKKVNASAIIALTRSLHRSTKQHGALWEKRERERKKSAHCIDQPNNTQSINMASIPKKVSVSVKTARVQVSGVSATLIYGCSVYLINLLQARLQSSL